LNSRYYFCIVIEYIGFGSLPDIVHRKTVKKGFEFTLMVVGESGLGKSTLINTLFLSDLYKERNESSYGIPILKITALR